VEHNITYTFGLYRLDMATELLWKGGACITIAPKIYRLLLYFLLNPGRLISHEELFNSVWDGRFVDDSAIRLAINSLRKALQDNSKSPEYISTVCKKGYRFIAKVIIKEQFNIAKADQANPLHYHPQKVEFPVWHGHSHQFTELVVALQESSNGKRRLVFLQGEQSVGKTALLDTFLATIHHPEILVLRARCVQMEGVAEPFMPLLEALERHCRQAHGKELIEHLNHLAPSWLHQMLNVLTSEELAMFQQKVAQVNTLRMLREGAEFIETLSKNATFILILDNAHWSDQDTLDLLNFLMFRCSEAKLLIIVSYRSCDEGMGVQRIAKMQAELMGRGLGQELSIQKHGS
jgi:DNA-binding winged helix-turn-helix (wHTH) protein